MADSIEEQYGEARKKAQDQDDSQAWAGLLTQGKTEGVEAVQGKTELDPKKQVLGLIESGKTVEEVEKEFGPGAGLEQPVYDPIDVFVDAATGGLFGATKAGIKGVAKAAGKDIVMGSLAGTFMAGMEKAGAGPVVQTLSGLIGPTATKSILTGSRQGFISFMRRIKSTNPKLHKQVSEGLSGIKDEQAQAVLNKILGIGEVQGPHGMSKSNIIELSPKAQEDFDKLNILRENWTEIIKKQRRGERPHALAREEGKLIPMSQERAARIAPGTAMNDAEASALIDYVSGVGKITQAAAQRGDMDSFMRGFLHLAEVIPSQKGVVAEAGRTLSFMNEPTSGLNQYIDQFASMLEETKGITPEKLMKMVAMAKTPEGMAQMAKEAMTPGVSNMLMEIWISDLLTSPTTHAANFLGNMSTTFLSVPERFLGGLLHTGSDPGMVKGEAAASLFGLVNGFMDSIQLAGHALKTGQSTRGTKIEGQIVPAITAKNLNVSGNIGRAVDMIGEFVRFPGRALIASDEFFKGINYRMELYAQAYRKAAEEGLSGKELKNKMAEWVQTPSREMKHRADQFADYQTFTKQLGETGQAIQNFTNSHPLAKVVMPFVRTPANIMKYSFERMPGLNLLMSQVRSDISSGGARRDMALAKMASGSMIMGAVASLSAAGYITGGGPKNRNLKRIQQDEGIQPYSIRVGDKYYSYNRLDPIGQMMGTVADFCEIVGQLDNVDAEEAAGAIALSVTNNLLSKTYLTGLSDVLDMIKSPDVKAGDVIRRMSGSIVPSVATRIRNYDDPVVREVNGIIDQFRSRTPGFSSTLPPTRNLKGDPILLREGWGPDILSPIYTSSRKHDPVNEQIINNKVQLSWPPKSIGGMRPPSGMVTEERPVHGVELTPNEYDEFVRLAGNELKVGGKGMWDRLTDLVASPQYQNQSPGPDGGRAYLIKSTVQGYRDAAELELRKRNPELDRLIRKKERERVEVRLPGRQ